MLLSPSRPGERLLQLSSRPAGPVAAAGRCGVFQVTRSWSQSWQEGGTVLVRFADDEEVSTVSKNWLTRLFVVVPDGCRETCRARVSR